MMDPEPLDMGYAQYLPAALRTGPADVPRTATFLERFVSVFEALISGDCEPNSPPPEHIPPEQVIDGLHHLFNPRRTRPELLSELAFWVGLNLPPMRPSARMGDQEWKEWVSRARLLIERMPLFYPRRWLKRGLYEALDVFVVNPFRPRIVIDDGEALAAIDLRRPAGECVFPLAKSRVFNHPSGKPLPFLVHPMAVAVGTAGGEHLIVADLGLVEIGANARRRAVWRLGVNGEPLDFVEESGRHRPLPVNDDDFAANLPASAPKPVFRPIAVVPAPGSGSDDETVLFVLDQGDTTTDDPDARILKFRRARGAPRFIATSLTSATGFPAVFPLDMVHDGAGRLHVLDRGAAFPKDAKPRLYVVSDATGAVATITLSGLREPRTLCLGPRLDDDPRRVLIVADARSQSLGQGERRVNLHGDLLRLTFDPAAPPASLAAESLLNPDQNISSFPLIQPTGMAADPSVPGVVYVCDQGYKWSTGGGGADSRPMSEPARVVRIDLRSATPRIVPVTALNELGFPARLAVLSGGTLVVVDHGYSFLLNEDQDDIRSRPHHFTVQVLYSRERLNPAIIDVVRQGGPGRNEVQRFWFPTAPTGGKYRVLWDVGSGVETSGLVPAAASAAALRDAIVAGMPSVGPDDLLVSGIGSPDSPFVLELTGAHSGINVPPLSIDTSTLTGPDTERHSLNEGIFATIDAERPAHTVWARIRFGRPSP